MRLFPTGERGHTRLAAALAAAGRLDEAITQWREAIRMVPDRWSSHLGLADAMLAAGDPATAAAECAEILEHEPRAIDAAVTLGRALFAQGEVADALACLKQAALLDPRHPQAQFQLGLILNESGQSEEAVAHLNEAIRLQPDNVPMLRHMAWILATDPDPLIRDGARALELAKKAVDLSQGQDLDALDALAAALAETGQFSAAADVAWQASMAASRRAKAICRRPWSGASACTGSNCRIINRPRQPDRGSTRRRETPTGAAK